MSFCLETYLQENDDYEILASKAGYKDCARIIRFKAPKIVNVKAGETVLGVRLIGLPPIPIGIDEEKSIIYIPYTKPCHGTAVIQLPIDKEEIENIKKLSID